jgi:hypothetical protein
MRSAGTRRSWRAYGTAAEAGSSAVHLGETIVVRAGFGPVSGGHASPLIPREHLYLVQRGQVPDGVAAHLGRAPVSGPADPEARGVDLAVPERYPGLAADQELPPTQSFGIVQDSAAEDLCIDPDPAAVPGTR